MKVGLKDSEMHLLVLPLVVGLTLASYPNPQYLNRFAAEVPGGVDEVKSLAEELGFRYEGQMTGFEGFHIFSHQDVMPRHKREAKNQTQTLSSHPQVLWFEQQKTKVRVKRSPLTSSFSDNERFVEREAYESLGKKFNDPMWTSAKQDWYMYDHTATLNNETKSTKMDLKILPVWQKGYTGKGVVITVLDDGLEWNHTDIEPNYAPSASYDVNDNDNDPFPRYDITNENQHGTRCAGVIAMVANNKWCGVGVAPDAKIGGIRMLDGPVTDETEARALSFNAENIDIMSASWGPSDNGKMVDGPGTLSTIGFETGINKGRRGLGIIYVWASGNGGHRGDNCICDGYVSSPYTISISSASTRMRIPYYVERCPSTMASTFSNGGYNELQIVSTDLHNECTEYFTGTSAAAPQGAGIIALVLEANPKLTWRDVQHLIVWTASPYILYNNEGWQTNAAGFKVHHGFGFGLLNAFDMVELAETWVNVNTRQRCEISVTQGLPKAISLHEAAEIDIEVDRSCVINYLEHVELVMTVNYTKRGDLSIDLTSAHGTQVSMMRPRENDYSSSGYVDWPFMSVQTWGEDPHGIWRVKVFDDQSGEKNHQGQMQKVMLRLFGTKEMPEVMKKTPGHRRMYNFRLKDVVKQKYSEPDATSDLLGTIGGFFNIG